MISLYFKKVHVDEKVGENKALEVTKDSHSNLTEVHVSLVHYF